jgi:sigma-54 dependent transcriptional regulator, acetoin dehydrogenase operon transcriptional activator AcoR
LILKNTENYGGGAGENLASWLDPRRAHGSLPVSELEALGAAVNDPTVDHATIDTGVSDAALNRRTVLIVRWLYPDPDRRPVVLSHGLTVGRLDDAQVKLDGAGVSRLHARVLREGPSLVLQDQQSRNGTFVNGRRVPCAVLQPGAVLRFGEFVGLVETRAVGERDEFGLLAQGLLGGERLRQALEPARNAATSTLPILIIAPTGGGKERVAQALHEWSGRRGPFRALNCAALPTALAEATLFGHKRGAFTGAECSALGYFRETHQGTLLLDEVGELPLELQAKLLRVLQEGEVTPVGESTAISVDVRILAAAQTPLAPAVERGRFRADLYMRLRGLEVHLPPLSARIADVPRLFVHFLQQYSPTPPAVESKLIESLCLYTWPGNVRELEWVARQLVAVHGREPLLKRRFLPPSIWEKSEEESGNAERRKGEVAAASQSRKDYDLVRLGQTLVEHNGNLSAACSNLNISRQRAYRLLAGRSVAELMELARR